MKQIDWSKFLLHCSGISQVLSYPRSLRPFTERQLLRLQKLKQKDELTDKEKSSLDYFIEKSHKLADPPLSKTAINFLTRRFAYEKYAKFTASKGKAPAWSEKGNILEQEGIELLSKLDKITYCKNIETVTNDFLVGKCDVYSPERNIILDIKVAWNINTFLSTLNAPLKAIYWYQMQGYLELYKLQFGEICFCLLSTPEDMVERERLKLLNKYVFGEIDREDFDKNMEALNLSMSYGRIPIKKRVIRFRVNRDESIMQQVYKKVQRCREWLNEFETKHPNGKHIVTLSETYAKFQEDDIEFDPTEPLQSD
jgi:hypothetical protein